MCLMRPGRGFHREVVLQWKEESDLPAFSNFVVCCERVGGGVNSKTTVHMANLRKDIVSFAIFETRSTIILLKADYPISVIKVYVLYIKDLKDLRQSINISSDPFVNS